MADIINSPDHYKLPGLNVEAIDVVRAVLGPDKFQGFCRGNEIKYLIRAERKNGIEDLEKAQKYLSWEIESRKSSGGGYRTADYSISCTGVENTGAEEISAEKNQTRENTTVGLRTEAYKEVKRMAKLVSLEKQVNVTYKDVASDLIIFAAGQLKNSKE